MVCVRVGRPPLLFIAMETSVLENIPPDPACNHHEGATRRCHVEGGDGWCPSGCGRTLGAAVPRCGLPTTVFRMAVCSWARVASMSVLGPDSQGRWASLLVSLLCFVRKRIFVTFSTVFVYMSYKIMIFQYKWKLVKVITYMCKSCLVSSSFGS